MRKVEIFIGPISCSCAGGPTPAKQEKITRAFTLDGALKEMGDRFDVRTWRLGDDGDYEEGMAILRRYLSEAGEEELAGRLAYALGAATPSVAVNGKLAWIRDCPTVEQVVSEVEGSAPGLRGDSRKKSVLFLCTANSCRSQMAEGLLRSIGSGEFDAYSAGASATSVHPLAIEVMDELGIDIGGQRSKAVDEFACREFDFVITVCADDAKESCPVFTGKAETRLSWSFDDPAAAEGGREESLEVFRRVRDEIREVLERFASVEDSPPVAG